MNTEQGAAFCFYMLMTVAACYTIIIAELLMRGGEGKGGGGEEEEGESSEYHIGRGRGVAFSWRFNVTKLPEFVREDEALLGRE